MDGVAKLEPARTAVASRTSPRLRIEKYWDVQFTPNERASEGELIEQLRHLLTESVALHQISDVPVGAFLSGGIDSSAVVALMSRPAAGRLKTFSIGFAESAFDELPHARQVAAQFNTDHHDVVLNPDVVQIVEDLTWYLDEPFGDTSAIPTYMVSKLASAHVKVVLSGDGGDELFAGYDKYVVEQRERRRDRIPAPLRAMASGVGRLMPHGMTGRQFLRHLGLTGARRYLDASAMLREDEMRRLFRLKRFDFAVAVATLLGALVFGVLAGVIIGVALSIFWLIKVSTRPHIPTLAREPGTDVYRDLADHPDGETVPGIVVIRMDGGLFFATSDALEDRVREVIHEDPAVKGIVLDCGGIDYVDSQGSAKLADVLDLAEDSGVVLRLARLKASVRSTLELDGVMERLGADHLHGNVARAVAAERRERAGRPDE